MTTNQPPTLEVDLSQGRTPEEHYLWNIQNAARVILNRPQEQEITLEVYELHKTYLRNTGFSEERLRQSDDLLLAELKRLADQRMQRVAGGVN
jgi:hypothetical protein